MSDQVVGKGQKVYVKGRCYREGDKLPSSMAKPVKSSSQSKDKEQKSAKK